MGRRADDAIRVGSAVSTTLQAGRDFLGIGLFKLFFIISFAIYLFILSQHPYMRRLWTLSNANENNKLIASAIGFGLLLLICSTFMDWPFSIMAKCNKIMPVDSGYDEE